jgi:poly(A) polymerase
VEIMEFLGVEPGPVVGEARSHLLDLRLDEGPMSKDDAYARLAQWATERGIQVAGSGNTVN